MCVNKFCFKTNELGVSDVISILSNDLEFRQFSCRKLKVWQKQQKILKCKQLTYQTVLSCVCPQQFIAFLKFY